MNIQAMMKQAQQLQKEMLKSKKEIDEKIFENSKSFVTITATGDKKIKSIKLNIETIESDEIEMVEDLILVTLNELMENIDKETEAKMGKYTKGIPGLF